MSKFETLREFAKSHWGLSLTRNNGRGYLNGDWKSGYSLSGIFPGERHSWRRFKTLKEVARVLQYTAPRPDQPKGEA